MQPEEDKTWEEDAPVWLSQACYARFCIKAITEECQRGQVWGPYLKGDMYRLILNGNHSDGAFALLSNYREMTYLGFLLGTIPNINGRNVDISSCDHRPQR